MQCKRWAFLLAGASLLISGAAGFAGATVPFLGRTYRLASYNQKKNPMWEFVTGNETVDNWTNLVTVLDRPDAKSRPDLDRLAQGVLDTYQASGGKILLAKTMTDAAGAPYNYTVAAFDIPAKHLYELNFVKAAMGPKNAYMMIYGVHITDPRDYVAKAKAFLNEKSAEVGKELGRAPAPPLEAWPRKVF